MDKYDPTNAALQKQLFSKHPLVTNQYKVLTPSMPIVVEVVMDAVELHKKSLYFKGLPQMGKTTCCVFAIKCIEARADFKDRFVCHVTADPLRKEGILNNIARSYLLALPKRPNLDQVRAAVVSYVSGRLIDRAGQHLVLFIDEMHTLTIADFENLQYLQNVLALRNVGVTVVGFGQTQITETMEMLRAMGRPELIARFLNEKFDLPRCEDSTWIGATAAILDDALMYPEGSDCTYTRFFLPQAYEAGLRLARISGDIYRIMNGVAKECNLAVLPTVYILDVIRFLLIRSRHNDAADFRFGESAIKDAVEESQLRTYPSTNPEAKR
ncbi:ATP-binding protein [Pseudomonas putida]|uniref:ATP-binding protein n=1 Tax=Pseudomonas putida TaxID=303 RepID=A0A6I6XHY1_PSEPU|nr:ATP-binding protein [Pseudomonas putida]QHG65158.1 ATP-binding protein [Pseudomonas putida]